MNEDYSCECLETFWEIKNYFSAFPHIGTWHEGKSIIYNLVNPAKLFDCLFLEIFMMWLRLSVTP